MDFPTDIGGLLANLQNFMMMKGGSLPAFTRDKLVAVVGSPSPVDRIVKAAEALYAVADVLDNEGRTVCAQLAQFAAINAWHGMQDDNRGGRIAQAMQREIGDACPFGEWPAKDDDPAALTEFVDQPASVAPAAPMPIVPQPTQVAA